MAQQIVHYSLHFLVIGIIAYFYDRKNWLKYWLILAATMFVDLDHLLADPVFDPERCGIGFHPLHSELAITAYVLGMIFIKQKIIRLISIGLFFHMFTDFIDCIWTYARCATCLKDIF
ncbi:DUF6122 family protein [Christiangramia forsetii]|uniref:Membrane-bound metal-dependent hydrolase n=2 Tax=Christiangramia forsetii TaxID=411153 RepID=A0LY46_CHRFK|nr:DUF6122 family protein [Christiangramia forsetii]GGG35018.1 hypothetical protein GCM10011532_18500 [Christiangramia forsetii]CAL65291.1 conserved hypothetical protein, membrane [Christiangramia forsetii KT0803]